MQQSVWQKLRNWLPGLLLLAGLIVAVSHIGELENFAHLVRKAEPVWLMAALVLQLATYMSVAVVWYLALHAAGASYPLWPLVPLGIAKLFSDQAMPSGGISGTAFFMAALNRRGISNQVCMATLLLSLVAYYGAYLTAALATLWLLHFYHAIHTWIVAVVIIFSLVAAGIPTGALWLRSLGHKEPPRILRHAPGLKQLMEDVAEAPNELMHRPALLIVATLLHLSVFCFDAATLWVMLQVVGMPVSFWAVFPCFVLASMVATIGPIPLGLGSFEATCVGMLGVMGVPVETALTATLLLRGFTLWLPMLPGMWMVRWALR
ncbi:MAG: flippase-like domain-containing protein [Desulfobulbus sp.]|nr:flippase-like domain-containing protein [Desulfobulbus sp.]